MSKSRNNVSRTNVQEQSQELIIAQQVHSGPLPHPEILRGYDSIIPGAAERILRMAETQSEHRQSIEKQVIDTQTKNSKHGVWIAAVLCLSTLIAGVVLVLMDKEIPGTIFGVSGLLSVVGVFIYGTRMNSKQ